MNSRDRLRAALNHQPVDRIPVDFGACATSGIHASAVHRLREALCGASDHLVKVVEPYQMLGEVDDVLADALGLDVVGLRSPRTMFGFPNRGWKPFTFSDGIPVLVPELFNTTEGEDGRLYMYPEGDVSAKPSAVMPPGGFFFDSLDRQIPLREEALQPEDNLEEFGPLSDDDLNFYVEQSRRLVYHPKRGVLLSLGGLAFGDIALVPAPWLKNPKGIRGVEEWYISLHARPEYVTAVFEKQCEIALANIDRVAEALGPSVDVIFVSGTDFGTQRGPIMSREMYRTLFKPYQKAVNDRIHLRTDWKTLIHSCGSVREFLPDFIDAGFDVLNPVQISASGMTAREIKREFGRDIVFWGGGVDTQKTLPFGSPEEVYREVRTRIEILGEGSGFVFNAIHNIQGDVPTENLLALFRAIKDGV